MEKSSIIRAINLNTGESLELETLNERIEFNMLAEIGESKCMVDYPGPHCPSLCSMNLLDLCTFK